MSTTSGVSDQVLSLPKGGGSVNGLGEKFQPDLHTGTGAYSIPLDIPNGPNDIAPSLNLQYSTGTGNGPFGMGFSLNLFTISCSTDKQIPSFLPGRDTLVLAGGGELVDAGNGAYRLRVDTNGWRFQRTGDGFTITDREGKFYRLGINPQARLFAIENGLTKNLSWLLEEIEDSLGNKVTFSYQRDHNQLYLSAIHYSIYRVEFGYESRPDIVRNGRAGFMIETVKRCNKAELHVDILTPSLTRRWEFNYKQSDPGNHSLLNKVKLSGFDDAGVVADSPTLSLDYTRFKQRELQRFQAEAPDAFPGVFVNGRRELIDWYGDGLPDLIEMSQGSMRVWRNLGDCTWARPRTLSSLPASLAVNDPAVAFADMDGSGTADLISLNNRFSGYYPHEPGGLFSEPVFWEKRPGVSIADPNARLTDLNGDGVADLLVSGDQYFSLYYRDSAKGWIERPQTVARSQAPAVALQDNRVHLADMTGDGFQDLVRVDGRGIIFWPYLGNGRWAPPITLDNPPDLPRKLDPARIFLNDVDGDGRADLVYVDADMVLYWINQGDRLSNRFVVNHTPSCTPEQVRIADMKGSGTAGVVWSYEGTANRKTDFFYLDFTGDAKPYLLNSVDNGMGATTTISYSTSCREAARDKAAGNPWDTFLPFPCMVVSQVETRDLPTNRTALSRYAYHEGHFDGSSREFTGFAKVDVEETGDESVPSMTTVNWFHNGLDPANKRRPLSDLERNRLRTLRGKLIKTEIFGLDGTTDQNKPYMRVENDWIYKVQEVIGGKEILYPYLAENRQLQLERQATPFRVKTIKTIATDAFGNITEQEERAFSPTDPALTRSLHTLTTFITDATGRFLSKPLRVEQRNESGQNTAITISYYDGLPEGQVGSQGLLTRQETLVLTQQILTAAYATQVPDFSLLGYHQRSGEPGWWINKLNYSRTDAATGLTGTVTNAKGQTSSLFYDQYKIHPVKVIDAMGNISEATYDYRANKVKTLKDANGVIISNRYDPLGRLIATVEPGATQALPSLSISYLTNQVPVGVTTEQRATNGSPDLIISRVFLDGSGQQIEGRSVTNTGEVIDRAQLYSARGTVKKQFLPYVPAGSSYSLPGNSVACTTFNYDVLGRLIKVGNADGTFVEQKFQPGIAFLYDEEDSLTGAGAIHSNTPRRHKFDPTGRISEVALNLSGNWISTFYKYDIKGDLLEVKDADGFVTHFVYDLLGRRLTSSSDISGISLFVYDANGNQVSKTDAGQARINFRYDALNRLLETIHADTAAVSASYVYHDTNNPAPPPGAGLFTKGKVVKVSHPGGHVQFGYDALGNVLQKTIHMAGQPSASYVFDYTYRADGKIESVTYPAPSPGAGRLLVRYEYNKRGLLSRIPGYITAIDYNASGQRTRVTFNNGVVTNYGYNNKNFRLQELTTNNAANVNLQQLKYEHDKTGNLLKVVSPDPKKAADYVYDDLYRLISASMGSGTNLVYSYDNKGNLLQKSGVGNYVYDAKGLLVSAGADTFTYTASGQMSGTPWGTCSYDAAGRLTGIVKGAEQMTNLYDQDGRCTYVRITGGANNYECHTPDDLITIENGTALGYIMDGPTRFAQVRLDNGATSYLHGDHLGSTSLVTGSSGEVLQQVNYDPFGAITENIIAAGNTGLRYLYTGNSMDNWSQLVYMKSRYYNPRLGRFLTPDNLVPDIYQPQAWNRFSYVQNNPIRYIDPTGHFWSEIGDWFEDNWKAVVAVVVIIAVVVLTIVSFGALAMIGVGIAMAIGGVIGGISAGAAGGDILTGILVGMAAGGVAAFAGMGIGAGMAAVFGQGTFLAAVATGTLSGAVSGAAMGFAAGFAGGQGSAGQIWEKVWQGALIGAASGAILGVGSGLFNMGTFGTGNLSFASISKEFLVKAGAGFLAGAAVELGREAAAANGFDNLNWGKILGAGLGGAALGSLLKFGGDTGLPVLNFLQPGMVGISSSIFAMINSSVFVLGYADDLWQLLKEKEVKTPNIEGSF